MLYSKSQTPENRVMVQVNLDGTHYYSLAEPFLNTFKKGTSWHDNYWKEDSNKVYPNDLEYNKYGYPMLPQHWQQKGKHIYTYHVLTYDSQINQTGFDGLLGEWILDWEGDADIQLENIPREAMRPGKNRVDVTLTREAHSPWFRISRSSESLRNIRFYQAKYQANIDRGEIFRPDFLELLAPYHCIRYMHVLNINGVAVTSADELASPEDAFWSASPAKNSSLPIGMPYETCLELSVASGTIPWLSINHAADESIIDHIIEAILKVAPVWMPVMIEYSNEVWNFANPFFVQTRYCEKKAIEELNYKGDAPWRYYYGWRSAEIIHKIRQACPEHTIQGVMATHTAYARNSKPPVTSRHRGRAIMTEISLHGAEDYLKKIKSRLEPKHLFDIAIASYFDNLTDGKLIGYTDEEIVAAVKEDPEEFTKKITHRFLTNQETGLLSSITSLREVVRAQKETADAWGMDLICYEGGAHQLIPHSLHNSAEVLEWYKDYAVSESMALQTEAVQELFISMGVKMLSDYGFVGQASKFGPWGTVRHMYDGDNPLAQMWANISKRRP